MNLKMLKAALAGLALSVSGFANAGLITSYTNQVDWENNVIGNIVLEDFNSITTDQLAPFNTIDFSLNAVGSFAHQNGIEAYPISIQQDRNIDGTTYFSGDVDNTVITILFNKYITAFSWEYTSLSSSDYFTILSQDIFLQSVGNPPSSAFFGIVSDTAFNTITISGFDGAFGADNFRYTSTTVPEPSTLAIFALCIMGLASRRFKKK